MTRTMTEVEEEAFRPDRTDGLRLITLGRERDRAVDVVNTFVCFGSAERSRRRCPTLHVCTDVHNTCADGRLLWCRSLGVVFSFTRAFVRWLFLNISRRL